MSDFENVVDYVCQCVEFTRIRHTSRLDIGNSRRPVWSWLRHSPSTNPQKGHGFSLALETDPTPRMPETRVYSQL